MRLTLIIGAAIGLLLLSASANAGEHRTGKSGSHPGGGVTVGPTGPSWRGGGRGVSSQPQPKIQPAPNVPHQKNWGIPGTKTGPYPTTFPANVRDHRSVRK